MAALTCTCKAAAAATKEAWLKISEYCTFKVRRANGPQPCPFWAVSCYSDQLDSLKCTEHVSSTLYMLLAMFRTWPTLEAFDGAAQSAAAKCAERIGVLNVEGFQPPNVAPMTIRWPRGVSHPSKESEAEPNWDAIKETVAPFLPVLW